MSLRLKGRWAFLALIWISSQAGLLAADASPVGGVVKGKVYDAVTLQPLPGATVAYGENRGTVTDGEGRFRIVAQPGVLNLTIQYVGYGTETRHVKVSQGDSLELNIAMLLQATEISKVVISAGKVEQRLSDLTVSVSVIRPDALRAGHFTDAQELMNKSSGIEVLDGQASIRGGSGYSYGAGSRVMVLVDGLPILSADAGHVRWSALPFENLSQVEIIKGASSVLYGSSALNGIINFRTAEATEEGVTRFYAESGVFGKPRRSEWVWWDTPRMANSASVTHLQKYGNTDVSAGGFLLIDNGYRKLNDNNTARINLGLKHRSKKQNGLTCGLSVSALHSRKQDFILWENGETGALKQDTSTAQRMQGSSLAVDPSVSFRQSDKLTHDLRSRFLFTRNDFPDGGQNNSDAASQYIEYQLRYTFSGVLSLNTGLMQYTSQVWSPFYGDHRAWNGALYAQADITPASRLKMVGGLRLENYRLDALPDKVVPLFRAGVNYRVAKGTFMRGSWGQGYRYPSIAEKHAATTLGAVRIFPNVAIQPESGWNAELGLKQGIKSRFLDGFADLALFYTQNSRMIEYVFGIYPDPVTQVFDFGFRANNIEHSRVYGLELEFLLGGSLHRFRYALNGGYVYTYPVEFNPITHQNTDIYLKFRRKHAFNINLSGWFRNYELGLSAFARSPILDIDDVFLNPQTREDILPGFYDYWITHNDTYFLMDASFACRIGDHFKISLALKNLTNAEYMGRPGDIQPHRHVSLRVSGVF